MRPAELVRRTCQALGALYRAQAPEGAVELAQFCLMESLLKHGPQTAAALVRLTGMDRSTLNTMVKRLKDGALLAQVMVETSNPGRNPMALSLTPRGLKALRKTEQALWNAEVQMMTRLTPEQRGTFLKVLEITAFSALPVK